MATKKKLIAWKEHAMKVSADWCLTQMRSAFVAEYADAHFFRDELNRLNGLTHSLMGRIGALKRRLANSEKGVDDGND